jgi:hypothetical protein
LTNLRDKKGEIGTERVPKVFQRISHDNLFYRRYILMKLLIVFNKKEGKMS